MLRDRLSVRCCLNREGIELIRKNVVIEGGYKYILSCVQKNEGNAKGQQKDVE